MYSEYNVVHLNLSHTKQLNEWSTLLKEEGLTAFSKVELAELDFTLGIYLDDELIATASSSTNIIKFVAIKESERAGGSLFNTLISSVISDLATRHIFHVFVFTKPMYSQSFQYLGFKELASIEKGCLLETGDQTIMDYLSTIPHKKGEKIASIVMNANPFTLGHRHLVETAATENEWVYLFVVSADRSLFTTEERYRLVQENTKHLENVIVCSGADYQVSPITFPTYFLKDTDDKVAFQTKLDASIFKKWFVPELNITSRYLGEEPFSVTTQAYNEALQSVLNDVCDVKVIPRKETQEGIAISATEIRHLLAQNQLEYIKDQVPKPTFDFIMAHKESLLTRIKTREEIKNED